MSLCSLCRRKEICISFSSLMTNSRLDNGLVLEWVKRSELAKVLDLELIYGLENGLT
jgi:hypothetical protein